MLSSINCLRGVPEAANLCDKGGIGEEEEQVSQAGDGVAVGGVAVQHHFSHSVFELLREGALVVKDVVVDSDELDQRSPVPEGLEGVEDLSLPVGIA